MRAGRKRVAARSAPWKSSFRHIVSDTKFVLALCKELAIYVLEFGSLMYVLYQVAKHL